MNYILFFSSPRLSSGFFSFRYKLLLVFIQSPTVTSHSCFYVSEKLVWSAEVTLGGQSISLMFHPQKKSSVTCWMDTFFQERDRDSVGFGKERQTIEKKHEEDLKWVTACFGGWAREEISFHVLVNRIIGILKKLYARLKPCVSHCMSEFCSLCECVAVFCAYTDKFSAWMMILVMKECECLHEWKHVLCVSVCAILRRWKVCDGHTRTCSEFRDLWIVASLYLGAGPLPLTLPLTPHLPTVSVCRHDYGWIEGKM